jgi:hypothetical protein
MVEPLKVRYGDDPEMDRWLELTDEQQEAEIAKAEAEYMAWWNGLTRLQQYRAMRRNALAAIARRNRLLTAHPFLADLDTFKEDIRVRLLRIRSFLVTGVYSDD